MESSAVQAERVCVKAEPSEDVCSFSTEEPFEGVFVKVQKAEPLDDVCVKAEPRCDGVSVKPEPSCSNVGIKAEPRCDGVLSMNTDPSCSDVCIKDELVERSGVRHETACNLATEVEQRCAIVPDKLLRDSHVRRVVVDTPLTGTQNTDRDNPEHTHGADMEHKNSGFGIVKKNKRGQLAQERPSRRPATHTGEKRYRCDQCSFATEHKNNLLVHIRKHTGERPYKCDRCSFASNYKCGLLRHTRIHTGEKPYQCDHCGYACNVRSSLIVHIRKHTNVKPFECHLCSYASNYKIDLLKHISTHTGERPYKCDECCYASTAKGNLLLHMKKKHTGEKRYKCDQCRYACNNKSILLIHIRKHTGEKPYKCDRLSYVSKKGKSLVRTNKRNLTDTVNHTVELPYKCDQCGYACKREYNFEQHVLKYHAKTYHRDQYSSARNREPSPAGMELVRKPVVRCYVNKARAPRLTAVKSQDREGEA